MKKSVATLLSLPFVLAHETPDVPTGDHETLWETLWHYFETNGSMIFGGLFVLAVLVMIVWLLRRKK